ncbi:tripartite tricarboxylate transporter TctB family protein [Lentibacillus salinarum]|uniref:Tripartite tricarboxylate transporter TctB family protein n=1 Tax=Lentibacillus salinarum TaxID=446820 RepID=A0ABW3ZVM8_9BACI
MGEIVIGILLILLSAIIYFNSGDFPQVNETHLDPGSYPKLIALLLALLAAALVIKQSILLVKMKTSSFDGGFRAFAAKQWKEYKLIVFILAALGLYIVFMDVIGFIITSILFMIAAGLIIGPRHKKQVIIISVISLIVTLGMYVFFENVLYIRFPDGLLL